MLDANISTFIESQFPEIYREDGPYFVEFVKQYYVWLETDATSPVYQTRNYLKNHDVDTTVDDFVIYFKEKYLKNIQLNTATNTKQLIKNSIDLYRSKGTENAIRLFFDLIFAVHSEVVYPGENVFKLSNAEWHIPKYIEVSSKLVNRLMVGRQVTGVYSGATAFVEKLVRRKIGPTFVEVFYISAIRGQFQTGEIITLTDTDTPLSEFPIMTGSLTALSVQDGGSGFSIGDVVKLNSSSGSQGKAVVSSLNTITGIVEFDLKDGGWGYTANSNIFVSEKVLQLANVQIKSVGNNSLYNMISTVSQPMANVQWYDNTAPFAVGETVYNYHANGSVRGESKILSAEYGNTTTSYFLLSTSSGNSAPYAPMVYTYYKSGNTANFKVYNAGWIDNTAKADVNGMSSNVFITYAGSANTFTLNETVYQTSSNNAVFAKATVADIISTDVSGVSTVRLTNMDGLVLTNFRLKGTASNANAQIINASLDIGVRAITGTFKTLPGNVLKDTGPGSLFSGAVINIPFGSGANVAYDTDLVNTEVVSVNPNFVRDHIDETHQSNWINAVSYGVSLNNASISTTLASALQLEPKTLGTIAGLKLANPGVGYSYAPFVVIKEPLIAPLAKMDFVIRIKNATGVFSTGEVVTQVANGAKGQVRFANTSEVHVRRWTYEDRWAVGNTTPYVMKGSSSGFEAQVIEVTSDVDGTAGFNADVSTTVVSSNSAALTLKVIDSGFNYKDNEEITFSSLDSSHSGTARSSVVTSGFGSGYHKTTAGFLSANKYLYDGDYYQDFSYEVKSPITVDRYSDMLKNILHVSGTKMFSSILRNTNIDSTTSVASAATEYYEDE